MTAPVWLTPAASDARRARLSHCVSCYEAATTDLLCGSMVLFASAPAGESRRSSSEPLPSGRRAGSRAVGSSFVRCVRIRDWQTDGLIQLKRFHRWFAVVLSTWSSAVLVWTATIELRRPTVKFIPAIVVFSVLIAFNLLSAWYLSRRPFREFAVQFVAEHRKERASSFAEKAAQKDAR